MDLLKELDNLNFSIKSRECFSLKILNNPKLVKEVIDLLNHSDHSYSEKILAVLEFASRKNPTILVPFSKTLIDLSKTYSGPSGTRALSKILFNFVKPSNNHLDSNQKENIITVCFDWLIRDEKVAVKAFSMQTLFLCSHEYIWIKEDLKAILNKDYSSQSAGYKACSRKILKNLE